MEYDELLQRAIDPDEQVLWVGKPEDSEPLEGVYKKRFIRKLVAGIVIAAALIIGYIIGANINHAQIYPLVIAVILVLAFLAPLNCVTAPKKLRKTTYAFTNKRVIVLRDTAHTVEYGLIKTAALKTDEAGRLTLLCGEDAVNLKPELWREDALLGEHMNDNMDECESLVMFGLPKDKKLMGIISEYLPA